MKARNVPALSLLAAIVLASFPTAEATLLVNWGTHLPTSNLGLRLGTASDTGKTRTYLDVQSPASSYQDTPFRAVLEQTLSITGPANFSLARLDQGGFLRIRGTAETESPATTTIRGMVYFEQAHFLNGGSQSTVTLTDKSTLALDVRKYNGTGTIRFTVLNGSQWYLSESSFSTTGVFTLTDFDSVNWAAWSPSSAPLPALPETFSVSTTSLSNITAFGFYFESTQSNISRYAELDIVSLQVDAVAAVPEPSVALLIGTVFLIVGARQFRLKSVTRKNA